MPNRLQLALRVLQRLQTHTNVTVTEMLRIFDDQASRRTVERIFQDIEEANIPLEVVEGAHGERSFSLQKGRFDIIPLMLTHEEAFAALQMKDLLEPLRGSQYHDHIRSMYQKLEQIVPEGNLGLVEQQLRVETDPEPIPPDHPAPVHGFGPILSNLFMAIPLRQVCQIVLDGSSLKFHPYSLVVHGPELYVVGYLADSDRWCYARVAEFEEMEVTGVTYKQVDGFNIAKVLGGAIPLREARQEATQAPR